MTEAAIAGASAASALILLVAVFYASLQVRGIRTASRAQLVSELSRRWDEEPIVECRRFVSSVGGGNELSKQLQNSREQNQIEYYRRMALPNFFEDLAILAESNCITYDLVKKSLGATVTVYWNLYKPFIVSLRAEQPTYYEHFEDLSTKMMC